MSPAVKAGWIDVIKQTFLDNFVHYTFLYFPVFYIFKNAFQGSAENTDVSSVVTGAMSQYRANAWKDNVAIWSLWVPADIIVYAVPIWMRLPLNHAVSLGWTIILSSMRGSDGH